MTAAKRPQTETREGTTRSPADRYLFHDAGARVPAKGRPRGERDDAGRVERGRRRRL